MGAVMGTAMGCQLDTVRLLLKGGADPNATGGVGVTPLFAVMALLGIFNNMREWGLGIDKAGEHDEDKIEVELVGWDVDENAEWEKCVTSVAEVGSVLVAAGDPGAKRLRGQSGEKAGSDHGQEVFAFAGLVPMDLDVAKAGFEVVKEALAVGTSRNCLCCTCTLS